MFETCFRGMHGLRTRSTVRSMAACFKQIPARSASEPRREAFLRYDIWVASQGMTCAIACKTMQVCSCKPCNRVDPVHFATLTEC